MEQKYEWLPHLYNALTDDTFGYTVTPYSIALEGWRRGLELTFHYTKQTKSKAKYSLSDGEKTHKFVASRGDLVTVNAMKICKDKYETKKYLTKAGVPTPEGEEFDAEVMDDEIIQFANTQGYPLVIKPVDGTGGRGVIANIRNEEELKRSLHYVRNELGFENVIVEDYFNGEDYRVYVVGNKAVAVAKRISPNVIGDGKATILELIKRKNKEKADTRLYKASQIKVDKELKAFLKDNGYSLEFVPKENERIFVKSKNNVTAGGDPVDATDELFSEAKEVAVRALNAIPELGHGGVDVMVNHETKEAIILEVNSQANIRLNLFPMEGKGRDIPKAIVDYYFPNTKQNLSSTLYFDFGDIWRTLKRKEVKHVTVPNHPQGDLKLARYIVKGKLRYVYFAKWVEEIAKKHQIQGYVKHLESGSVSIVASGLIENMESFKNELIKNRPEKYADFDIEQNIRKNPVMIGFYVINEHFDVQLIDGYQPVRLQDPKSSSKTTKRVKKVSPEKKKAKPKKAVDRKQNINSSVSNVQVNQVDYQKKYYNIVNSTSWKLTKPIRLIGKIVKGK